MKNWKSHNFLIFLLEILQKRISTLSGFSYLRRVLPQVQRGVQIRNQKSEIRTPSPVEAPCRSRRESKSPGADNTAPRLCLGRVLKKKKRIRIILRRGLRPVGQERSDCHAGCHGVELFTWGTKLTVLRGTPQVKSDMGLWFK